MQTAKNLKECLEKINNGAIRPVRFTYTRKREEFIPANRLDLNNVKNITLYADGGCSKVDLSDKYRLEYGLKANIILNQTIDIVENRDECKFISDCREAKKFNDEPYNMVQVGQLDYGAYSHWILSHQKRGFRMQHHFSTSMTRTPNMEYINTPGLITRTTPKYETFFVIYHYNYKDSNLQMDNDDGLVYSCVINADPEKDQSGDYVTIIKGCPFNISAMGRPSEYSYCNNCYATYKNINNDSYNGVVLLGEQGGRIINYHEADFEEFAIPDFDGEDFDKFAKELYKQYKDAPKPE